MSRPEVLTSLLADLLPGADKLVQLVAAAAQCRVAEDLRGHVAQGLDAGTATTLVGSSFAAATLYAPEACAWVVTEFASALGLTIPAGQPAPDVIPAETGPVAVMSLTRQAPGGDLGGAPTVTAYPPAAGAPGDSPAGPAVYAGRQRESGVAKSGFLDWDPQISKRFWYIAAYLIPIIGIGWIGTPVLVILTIDESSLVLRYFQG